MEHNQVPDLVQSHVYVGLNFSQNAGVLPGRDDALGFESYTRGSFQK